MTPSNIAGMAALKGLDVIALTDHNSCRNCPALLRAAAHFGLVALPGMELCTMEEVHVLCLFANLNDALDFDAAVYPHILPISNDEALFGQQLYYDENDAVCGTEPRLLISATDIPFADVFDFAARYHGLMIPAHIDKPRFSILSQLGFVPKDLKCEALELSPHTTREQFLQQNAYLSGYKFIRSSDAHYVDDIGKVFSILSLPDLSFDSIRSAITAHVS